jgi:hypothetical protein
LTIDDHAAERDAILAELATIDGRRVELSKLWAAGSPSSADRTPARWPNLTLDVGRATPEMNDAA